MADPGPDFALPGDHVLPKIESADSSGCRVLDIGAGNGWLSYRLAKRGYHPIAVDLMDNDVDGLGAARHFLAHSPRSFQRFQADMDHLPFDGGQFDVAIFNASFHYSSDYERTLREVLRCLRRPGTVVVADSPFYRREESGKQMLEERRRMFERQFGIRSDINHCSEYLTQRTLDELAERLAIQWNVGKPWYGLSCASSRKSSFIAPPRAFEVLSVMVQSRLTCAMRGHGCRKLMG